MAFETWFNDYLLKVRGDTNKVNLQKWYDEVYIGELMSYSNRYLAELKEEKKAATTPKEILRIEAKVANIYKNIKTAEEESKTNLMSQLEALERKHNEKKTAKKLATSLARALAEPVVADNEDEQLQENSRITPMTSG